MDCWESIYSITFSFSLYRKINRHNAFVCLLKIHTSGTEPLKVQGNVLKAKSFHGFNNSFILFHEVREVLLVDLDTKYRIMETQADIVIMLISKPNFTFINLVEKFIIKMGVVRQSSYHAWHRRFACNG